MSSLSCSAARRSLLLRRTRLRLRVALPRITGGSASAVVLVFGAAPLSFVPGASFQPGALIGNFAFYAATPRTAWVVANTSAELLKVYLDRLEPAIWQRPVAPPQGGALTRSAPEADDGRRHLRANGKQPGSSDSSAMREPTPSRLKSRQDRWSFLGRPRRRMAR